jgi:hypothetical protein
MWDTRYPVLVMSRSNLSSNLSRRLRALSEIEPLSVANQRRICGHELTMPRITPMSDRNNDKSIASPFSPSVGPISDGKLEA